MNLMTLIKDRETCFVGLCRLHRVNKIYAFGSSVTDHFNPDTSDIDPVVKSDISDPADRGKTLVSFRDKLESLFNKKADLLTENSIRNPCLKAAVDRTKKIIYDGEGEKTFV